MKRKCKNVHIDDLQFIETAIIDCINHKTEKKLKQRGYYEMIVKYGSIHNIAIQLQSEIINRSLKLPPVKYVDIIDSGNGKHRTLMIEHIKQQFCDYIAFHGLKELYSRFGYYQINVREHGSPIMAARYVQAWMRDPDIKYVAQLDIKKCYPSITKENMMKWLNKHVANPTLLWLIDQLLAACNIGLPIGSRLSINLCALYLSDIYHHIENHYYSFRKGKKIHAVKHTLFYLDDNFLFGSNARALTKAVNDLIKVYALKGLTIKPDWKMICLKRNRDDTHIDILGYKVYHDRITMRRRDYVKTRHAIKMCKSHPNNLGYSYTYISLHGLFIEHTNSEKFKRKYNSEKYYLQARKVVSKNARSKVFGKAKRSNSKHRKRSKAVHTVPKRTQRNKKE